jgi:multidrug efflux system outer membrane protein
LNLLTFEVDIWGRLRKATAAAKADLLATEESTVGSYHDELVGDVASAYFNLRELDFELEHLTIALSASRQESVANYQLRQTQGVSTMLEVRQAEDWSTTRLEVIPRARTIR